VEDKEARVPMGNQAVLPEAELRLDLSVVRESRRVERKRGRNLLRRLLVLRHDRLYLKFEINGGPGCLLSRRYAPSCRQHFERLDRPQAGGDRYVYSSSAIWTAFNAAPLSS